jgi:hypothetical protein
MRNSRLTFGVTLMLSLASASCMRQKTLARVFIPPPARPQPVVSDVPATLADPPELSADIEVLAPPPLPELPPDTLEVPEAPKRIPRRTTPPVSPARPPANGNVTPETPAPRLAQRFTPEELRQNTRALEESLDSVNRILAVVEAKNLTADQKEIAERIKMFRKQAEQAKEEDLLTAVNLARRADLLAKDLLQRLP